MDFDGVQLPELSEWMKRDGRQGAEHADGGGA